MRSIFARFPPVQSEKKRLTDVAIGRRSVAFRLKKISKVGGKVKKISCNSSGDNLQADVSNWVWETECSQSHFSLIKGRENVHHYLYRALRLGCVPGAIAIAGLTGRSAFASISGFGDGSDYTLTGYTQDPVGDIIDTNPPTISSGDLTITTSSMGEARAAFYNTPQSIGSFTAQFIFQNSDQQFGSADGFSFVLQNDSRGTSAIGGGGAGLGYGLQNTTSRRQARRFRRSRPARRSSSICVTALGPLNTTLAAPRISVRQRRPIRSISSTAIRSWCNSVTTARLSAKR